ncbi:MAG: tetratricopeptide repeat protein, partial [Candidatus Hodarchaeales archaeon]
MDLTILAVHWDDISGPSIISLFPHTTLNDPESVALQIYLASVTVFGQHGHSQRTEFSVPLLSLGQDITARVAFDSWLDTSLRGKERPFFLAFLTDQTTGETLNSHLNDFIFKYLDTLKDEKSNFSAQQVWGAIIKTVQALEEKEKFDAITFEVDSEYAIPRALEDLETANDAWESLKDRNQLWTALRVANRLENVDDKGAGSAFTLVGRILLTGNSYREAGEAFEKATNCYNRVRLFEEAGETSYFAGKCAYHLEEFERAIELIQAATLWIKDPASIASLNYDMGIVLHEQSRYEESNVCFEKAVRLATEIDKQIAAEYSSTFASRLMYQAEKEKEENPAYALGLIRRSADQREEASRLLQLTEEGSHNAATSLILAVSAYFSLGNKEKGVTLLEEATNLFIEAEDYISAGRSLYDGARMIRDEKRSYELLSRAIALLEEQEVNIQEYRLMG